MTAEITVDKTNRYIGFRKNGEYILCRSSYPMDMQSLAWFIRTMQLYGYQYHDTHGYQYHNTYDTLHENLINNRNKKIKNICRIFKYKCDSLHIIETAFRHEFGVQNRYRITTDNGNEYIVVRSDNIVCIIMADQAVLSMTGEHIDRQLHKRLQRRILDETGGNIKLDISEPIAVL